MKIAVLGTGSWATGLSQVLCDNGHKVMMYGVDDNEISDINERHQNSKYFSDVSISQSIVATKDAKTALDMCEAVVIAVPTLFVSDVLSKIKPFLPQGVIVINASKGFDPNTNCRMTDTIRGAFGDRPDISVASVIGPSHAEEVILRKLTAICAVSTDEQVAKKVQKMLSNQYIRLYVCTDEIGAEYGVSFKNVIAIASGILVGRGYGDNAKAALITRGLAEMVRYGTAKGGLLNTFFGLTGVGDLVVTCFSEHSRNYQAGIEIGQADGVADFYKNNHKTVEGIYSCKVIYEDSKRYGFEMPLVKSMYEILYNNRVPSDSIKELMDRPLKVE
ncbi:MAG: NAD(P)-dependent glycerol-3-phosphate dehydrogenase [Eubacteriales bacterium]|nr:NAD(P)-dependent glycerol-3-phosphate dehydrogenase [Eubacteriales bacterium]